MLSGAPLSLANSDIAVLNAEATTQKQSAQKGILNEMQLLLLQKGRE